MLLFLALGGIYGGIILILDPSGSQMGWTTDLLHGTPFSSFKIPGIILFLFNGLLPAVIFVVGFLNNPGWFKLVIIQGLILIIWLTTEVLLNSDLYSPLMHPIFYFIAVILIFLGLILNKLNKVP